jgi:hypothetical protein
MVRTIWVYPAYLQQQGTGDVSGRPQKRRGATRVVVESAAQRATDTYTGYGLRSMHDAYIHVYSVADGGHAASARSVFNGPASANLVCEGLRAK